VSPRPRDRPPDRAAQSAAPGLRRPRPRLVSRFQVRDTEPSRYMSARL